MTATVTEPRSTAFKRLYTVEEAAEILSYSRSVVYRLMQAGRLRSVKEGHSRRIPAAAIEEYTALLDREAEATR